jgi:hypothetical protein
MAASRTNRDGFRRLYVKLIHYRRVGSETPILMVNLETETTLQLHRGDTMYPSNPITLRYLTGRSTWFNLDT